MALIIQLVITKILFVLNTSPPKGLHSVSLQRVYNPLPVDLRALQEQIFEQSVGISTCVNLFNGVSNLVSAFDGFPVEEVEEEVLQESEEVDTSSVFSKGSSSMNSNGSRCINTAHKRHASSRDPSPPQVQTTLGVTCSSSDVSTNSSSGNSSSHSQSGLFANSAAPPPRKKVNIDAILRVAAVSGSDAVKSKTTNRIRKEPSHGHRNRNNYLADNDSDTVSSFTSGGNLSVPPCIEDIVLNSIQPDQLTCDVIQIDDTDCQLLEGGVVLDECDLLLLRDVPLEIEDFEVTEAPFLDPIILESARIFKILPVDLLSTSAQSHIHSGSHSTTPRSQSSGGNGGGR
eukprot:gene38818-47940_t